MIFSENVYSSCNRCDYEKKIITYKCDNCMVQTVDVDTELSPDNLKKSGWSVLKLEKSEIHLCNVCDYSTIKLNKFVK